MGFLGYGQERLVIESRFSTGTDDYFFQYLLERFLDFPNILDLNTVANHDIRLFQLLLFLFPHYLKSAMRKGIYKTYVRNHYNDGNVKGTIDIARHISKNTPFTGKIAYRQREFSLDNSLMELVRHTIEFIKTKSYGHQLLYQVKDEVSNIIHVTPGYEYCDRSKIVFENKKNPIRHAYFNEYRELQLLCILILQHERHRVGSGIRPIHGILFDGAWLWEEYIYLLIGEHFFHPMNKKGNGAQRLFNRNTGLIYPDFISRDSENRVIADAKYKPVTNIGNRDYLQVLAYMFRFDAKKGYYFYPESGEIESMEFRLNRGSTYEKNVVARDDITLVKCGLHIPCEAMNYEQFKNQMIQNEARFLARI